ncbi:protein lethal(2)essential for life [Nilaparvata lugens]|uniref:protein lethal(2)essential for life n=1 Tax=Nilaparvata lugens TaxID=108931 RepID=UPI000B98D0B1|nr:protein lethal(2)essential for life [Nilaparvata lugens]XP_039278153.1 protein lethal(2)essential for life [Nilaparvata lugens]XP_039278154.1 protein lethal(2)essential for life [Nilaparvata lugens]
MSLVPLLFRDWWDDFDTPHHHTPRASRLLDQHFGLGLNRDELVSSLANIRPSVLRTGYIRPWSNALVRQNSGVSNLTADNEKVQVSLDVQQFAPSEITVKTVDGTIIVEGKHEEKQDEHGFISRHFVRKYVLPKDVDSNNITSSLSSDGVLTISAPKLSIETKGERSIPIIQTGTPAVKAADKEGQ